jgi:hypothetical protein
VSGRKGVAHAPLEAPQARESRLWIRRVGVRLAYFALREDVYLRIRDTFRYRDQGVGGLVGTYPRACAQFLDRGINRRLVYPHAAESLQNLTFPEECGEDAAGA